MLIALIVAATLAATPPGKRLRQGRAGRMRRAHELAEIRHAIPVKMA